MLQASLSDNGMPYQILQLRYNSVWFALQINVVAHTEKLNALAPADKNSMQTPGPPGQALQPSG